VFVFSALLVAGCLSTAPIVDFATPASISIRYDPWLFTAKEAGNVAQKHCLKHEKNAAIVDRKRINGGWDLMSFDCR